MRHISFKSVFARLSGVIMLFVITTPVSAQYYLNVFEKSGNINQYDISNLDSINISDIQNSSVNYEYVDLGLSVNWATCNIGAKLPSDFGKYYAWGELQEKEVYYSDTYRWNNYTGKYVASTLKPSDDVAHVICGDEWRMPTKQEFLELMNDCTWELVTLNGIGGYKVTSKISGYTENSIFIPLAGYYNGNNLVSSWKVAEDMIFGSGFYWSSSIDGDKNEPYYLWLLNRNFYLSENHPQYFTNDSINICRGDTPFDYPIGKQTGFTVRPVQPSASWLDSFSISLNKESATIQVDDELYLTATLKVNDHVVDQSVKWSSDKPTVVYVFEDGRAVGFIPGEATITATSNGKTATCLVTVVERQYTEEDIVKIILDKGQLNLTTGDNDTLSAIGIAYNGLEIPLDNVIWSSDNPTVASVNSLGIISASNEGVAHITASVGNISETCTVFVEKKISEVGLYLGVMGFNKHLYTQPINILNATTKTEFDNFIDGMQMEDGTLLCYSVDNALDALHGIAVPENLSTVAVVTFTDGLDEGSVKKISYNPYRTRAEYLAGIKQKISSDSIEGVPVTAYSIGLRGSDVTDVTSFQSALKQLASQDSYAMEVKDMNEVNAKFEQIARTLNRSINYQTVPIVIPGPDDGDRLRFTFDITKDDANSQDALSSELYIEGTFNVEFDPLRFILKDVEYHGMDSLSGSVIIGEEVDEFIKFTFEKVLTNDSTFLSKEKIKEWHLTQDGLWQKNSEFKPDQQPDIETRSSSAIIMLVLDCSSSLNTDFPKVQEKAKSFINILYSSYGTPTGGGGHNSNSGGYNTSYEYVDLGLSVLWATCNVDASNPEDYGNYYAWGETETKETFDWTTYKYCNGSGTTLTKYSYDSSYGYNGFTDGKTILDLEDDVAHVKWGGNWRMPTKEELKELINNCTWTSTTQNGVNGFLVTSNISGYTDQSIFLPSAGMSGGYKGRSGYIYYWTSTLASVETSTFGADSWFCKHGQMQTRARYYGMPIRPVMPNPNKHEYVDLGLSVKWATCNVGASNEEEMGDFYAWGETETKELYKFSTYKWSNGGYYNNSDNLTKYCNDSNYGYNGFTDGKTTLDLEDDVAHVKWGGNWRIPSYAECQELLEKCTWTQTVINGVNGYVVTSNIRGYENNSIFLPTRYISSTDDYCGTYWTNTVVANIIDTAWVLSMRYPSDSHYVTNHGRMFEGSVRPVCP